MDDHESGPALPAFLPRALPPGFVRRVVTLAPGAERPYVQAEWEGALVIVGEGEIEVGCPLGGARRFAAGSIIWLVDLDLSWIRNPGAVPARLTAITRA